MGHLTLTKAGQLLCRVSSTNKGSPYGLELDRRWHHLAVPGGCHGRGMVLGPRGGEDSKGIFPGFRSAALICHRCFGGRDQCLKRTDCWDCRDGLQGWDG